MTGRDVRRTGGRDGSGVEDEPRASPMTIAVFECPAADFALEETMAAFPDATFECEHGVQGCDSFMPLLWAGDVRRSGLDDAVRADPSLASATVVEDGGADVLYHVEWTGRVRMAARILAEEAIAIPDARATGGRWSLELLFPTRTELSRTKERCDEFEVDVGITMVREHSGEPTDRFDLTDRQAEALTAAYEQGYFEVPKAVDLDGVADELDVSHQSLSGRLRRGQEALIRSTIVDRGL